MNTNSLMIQVRSQHLVNTDPQRRCSNGCHAKSELQWSAWEDLESTPPSKLYSRIAFWKGLNDYAVSQRGIGALKEFRSVFNKQQIC